MDNAFGFAEHPEIGLFVGLRARHRIGTTHGDRLAARLGQLNNDLSIVALRQHSARHHDVGPIEVGRFQFLGIAIDELDVPVFGQQRRKRHHSERGGWTFNAINVARCLQAPERILVETRKHHQNFGRSHRTLTFELRAIPHGFGPDNPLAHDYACTVNEIGCAFRLKRGRNRVTPGVHLCARGLRHKS